LWVVAVGTQEVDSDRGYRGDWVIEGAEVGGEDELAHERRPIESLLFIVIVLVQVLDIVVAVPVPMWCM
jgi:hypothetical protein